MTTAMRWFSARINVLVAAGLVVLLLTAAPAPAIQLDDRGDMRLGLRTYFATRMNTEAQGGSDDPLSWPNSGTGHIRQERFFLQLKFDHDKDSRYPLTGKHAKVVCSKCHWAPAGQLVKYRPVETACKNCHEDAHAGQLGTECEKCHNTKDFKAVSFEHQPPNTRFALDGKHAPLKCDACHKKVQVGGGKTAALYKPLPLNCEGCHSDFHQGAFKGFEP